MTAWRRLGPVVSTVTGVDRKDGSDRPAYPEPAARDQARAFVEAAINAVPGIGGTGATLLNFYLPSALERRRVQWLTVLDERLADLESQVLDDEGFLTIVLQATKAALGTHLEEKLELLAGGVASAASWRSEDQFMAMRHLRHVEALDPEHFRLLHALNDHQLRVEAGLSGPDLSGVDIQGLPVGVLGPCIRDLDEEGLAISADPAARASIRAPGGTWTVTITPEGRELLRFVQYMVTPW